ncbi:MAG: hypothetical protein KIS83_06440 [Rubrivivax sp.]|nr:hypothetical protein [Rubrivivax sp.]
MPTASTPSARQGLALACGLLAGAALASPSVVTLDAPGGFVTACGGISGTTGAAGPGDDLQAFYLVDSSCQWQGFTSGVASASAAFDNGVAANDAGGQVGWGFMQLAASNVSTNDAGFPYGTAQAGWEDRWTVDAPGYTGQPGTMTVSLQVSGQWVLSGFAGAARVSLQPYIDSAPFSLGGSLGTQHHAWGSSFFPTGVDEVVQLVLPFTFGEAFDIGIFVILRAGLRSQSAVPGLSTAHADFMNTITWQGIDGVRAGDLLLDDYTLAAASGVDWSGPIAVIPEPPPWLTLAAGLALLALRRRAARRGAR